ncbi:DMT family transporter [Gaetbulibacter saemankumensis]|uniref:DMT family transporter n=1 Tax=Gaetbulibacter saemankumensis TaxID=311208 RepID=UPI00041F557C|nr:DMT family transporter [Gaetbulibacter saemankumensis]
MKSTKSFVYGVLLAVLGIILFSSKAVMVKLAYNYNIDALSVLLLRMLFSFPFYVVVALWYRKRPNNASVGQKDYIWLFLFGFLGYYLSSYFDFMGLVYLKASLERIILFLYPTIVLLFNRFFLKKPISRLQILAIAITYFGVVITFWGEVVVSGSKTYLGGLFILLCAISYAAYISGTGWLVPKFGVAKFTSYVMIVSCLCVFVHFGIMSEASILGYPWQVYLLGFLIAIFATVIPSYLVSEAIKRINSSNFAVVAGIGPISTIILAAIFLNEHLTVMQLLGAIIVIVGIFLVSYKKHKSL